MATETTPWKDRIRSILSQRQRVIVCRPEFTPSAVLVPVYENRGEYYIVLTKRSEDLEHHKGQVSFPGGSREPADRSLEETALREAFEEIGLKADDVEILGQLDEWATLTSNFIITPFVGALPYPYPFIVNQREVDVLIEAPVSALMDPFCIKRYTLDYERKPHPGCSFHYNGQSITGITARILDQFLKLVFT